MSSKKIATELISLMKKEANVEFSKGMKSYMKNLFDFYGIKAPVRAKILQPYWKEHKPDIEKHFREIVQILWAHDKRECQHLAMDILQKCKKKVTHEDLDLIEQLITTKSWWDTVDFLASHMIGHIFMVYPELKESSIERYLNSNNMWLQRTTLIFQLKYKDETDEQILYDCIRYLLGSKEFFINKAIGWSLRQFSKYNPESVRNFIEGNKGQMANVSIREGSKYL